MSALLALGGDWWCMLQSIAANSLSRLFATLASLLAQACNRSDSCAL